MATFGSISGVSAFVKHMELGEENNPLVADVTVWLATQSGKVTGWLAVAGYPLADVVANTEAKAVLDNFVNLGVAGLAELSQRVGGYDSTSGEDRRESRFLAEFAKAEAWIKSGALEGLGVTKTEVVVERALALPSVAVPTEASW